MDEHGRTWTNMDEHRRTIHDGVGKKVKEHGRTWKNLEELGRTWTNMDEMAATHSKITGILFFFPAWTSTTHRISVLKASPGKASFLEFVRWQNLMQKSEMYILVFPKCYRIVNMNPQSCRVYQMIVLYSKL